MRTIEDKSPRKFKKTFGSFCHFIDYRYRISDLLNELKKSCRIVYPMFLCCTLTLISIACLQVKVKSQAKLLCVDRYR